MVSTVVKLFHDNRSFRNKSMAFGGLYYEMNSTQCDSNHLFWGQVQLTTPTQI